MSLNQPLGILALMLSALTASGAVYARSGYTGEKMVDLYFVRRRAKWVAWLAIFLILVAIFLLAVDINKSHPLLKFEKENLIFLGSFLLGLLVLLYSIFSQTGRVLYLRAFSYLLFLVASVALLLM